MTPHLTKREIGRILRRHRGSQVEVANRAGVKRATVAVWLKYGTSAKVEMYANMVAAELLVKEASARIGRPTVREVLPVIRSHSSSESQG